MICRGLGRPWRSRSQRPLLVQAADIGKALADAEARRRAAESGVQQIQPKLSTDGNEVRKAYAEAGSTGGDRKHVESSSNSNTAYFRNMLETTFGKAAAD